MTQFVYENDLYGVTKITPDEDGNNWAVVNKEEDTVEYLTPVKPQALLICEQFAHSLESEFWVNAFGEQEPTKEEATLNKIFVTK